MCHPFSAKDQNGIQISLLEKMKKLTISLEVTQLAQNTK
jgi:hypothetical protein